MITAPPDRCPACCHPAAVEPGKATGDRGSVTARYKCPHCKAKWFVCWDTASLETAA